MGRGALMCDSALADTGLLICATLHILSFEYRRLGACSMGGQLILTRGWVASTVMSGGAPSVASSTSGARCTRATSAPSRAGAST
jgi:hypothetical protein